MSKEKLLINFKKHFLYKMSAEKIEEVVRGCAEREIVVKRMRITIEELN